MKEGMMEIRKKILDLSIFIRIGILFGILLILMLFLGKINFESDYAAYQISRSVALIIFPLSAVMLFKMHRAFSALLLSIAIFRISENFSIINETNGALVGFPILILFFYNLKILVSYLCNKKKGTNKSF